MSRFNPILRAYLTSIATVYLIIGTLLLDPIIIGCALAILLILRRCN